MSEKKGLFQKIRDTIVQEDNPNSPHRVFARMNENMLGDKDTTSDEAVSQKGNDAPKKKPGMMTPEQFDELIWGSKEK